MSIINRRNFLKTGIELSTIGLATRSAASQGVKRTKKSLKNIDISYALLTKSRKYRRKASRTDNNILKNRCNRLAKRLESKSQSIIGQCNVRHNSSRWGGPEERNDISTQKRYSSPANNENTELWFDGYCYLNEEDEWVHRYTLSWELHEQGEWLSIDKVCVPDGAAIYWNDHYWQPVEVGRSNFRDASVDSRFTSGQGSISYGESDLADGGILADIDVPKPGLDGKNATFWGEFSTHLKPVADGAIDHPVKGKYKHTWNTTGCLPGDFQISLSAGDISISGGSPSQWTM
jgi:hypothetical protein